MSGRKTSTVTMGPTALEQLAATWQRRATQRRARRAAEAERRQREQLQRRRETLRADLAQVAGGLNALGQTDAGRRIAADISAFGQLLSSLQGRKLAQEADVTEAANLVKKLRRQIAEATARAELEQLAADVAHEQAVLLVVKRQTAAMRPLSTKFDPQGLQQLDRLIAEGDARLKANDPAQARQTVEQLHERFAAHRELVEREQERFNNMRDATTAALAEGRERVNALQGEEAVRRWSAADLERLEGRLAQAERTFALDRFSQARNELAAIIEEADRLAGAAEEQQRCQDQRDYVANSIMEGLSAAGFWVEVQRAGPGTVGTTLKGTLTDGRAIAVTVPDDEGQPLEWTPEGFPMGVVAGADGRPARACDEAAAQIEAVKAYLAAQHGIETGDLNWPGKDPTRPAAKRANHSALPSTRRKIDAQF